jgi:hypothetical protein
MRHYTITSKTRLRDRAMAGVAARQAKRLAESESLIESGGLLTWGCLGHHDIRLLAYPDGRHVAVVVDGVQKRPRTLRGVWRVLAGMVSP